MLPCAIRLDSNAAIDEGALSVFGRRQAKGTSEITHEMALTLVAYLGHDLLYAQQADQYKVTGFFHSESAEIFSRRESGLSFEKARNVRRREISHLRKFG